LTTGVQFGLLVPHFTDHASMELLTEGSRLADSLGFDSLWVRDHLFISPDHREHGGISDPGFITEATLTLAMLGGITSNVKLGSAIITPHRHAMKVAQLFATLDYMTGGRAIMGVGLGWDVHEFNAVQMPFDRRHQLLRETVAVCRRAWQEPEFSFEGEEFSIPWGSVNPRPVHGDVPVWYGGLAFKGVELAAEFCDGWLPSRMPFDRLVPRIERARELIASRESEIPVTFAAMPQTSVARSADEALSGFNLDKVKAEALHRKPVGGGRTSLTLEDLEGYLIWGNGRDLCAYVERFVAIGVTHIVFDMRASFGSFLENVRVLGTEVLPEFRS
jgi:alkanesulfonate monooxygenase SsuD/methylene tetrahydromethanopterin reductase-like flavin-dependent oxidoreductase (luciferase family)